MRSNEALVFVDGRPIGNYNDGTFTQWVTRRHIYRQLNAKGIDIRVHADLKARGCRQWEIVFTDTAQILKIPFAKITACGISRHIPGAGDQIMVPLSDFNESRPVLQGSLI